MSGGNSLSQAKQRLLSKLLRGEMLREGARKRPTGSQIPLSLVQEEIWYRAQAVAGRPPLYNESVTVHRHGPLSSDSLQRSFTEIVRRHEIWRTTFGATDGRPFQVIHPAPPSVPMPVLDLRSTPELKREQMALCFVSQDATASFDLESGPLFRLRLVRLNDEEYRLFVIMHQIILDGVSAYQVFLPELITIYEAFSQGKQSPLSERSIQFSDYAYWQRHSSHIREMDTQLEYWRTQLSNCPATLKLPVDHTRPVLETFRGAIEPFAYPPQLASWMRTTSRDYGITMFSIQFAAVAILLYCYTRQQRFFLGTVSPSGRKEPDAQGQLGYFLNPLPVLVDLSGNPTFREVLQRANKQISEVISSDGVPFGRLVNEFAPQPDPSRNPFFQVATSLEPPMPKLPPGWNFTPMDVSSGGARWDIYLVLDERPDAVLGRVQYNPDLFEVATIRRMVKHLKSLLENILSAPKQHLSDLSWLSLTESQLIHTDGEAGAEFSKDR